MVKVKDMVIDVKDAEVLYYLSLDARATLKELSKKTNLSKEVIHHRLKKLEKNSIIENYYAVINTYNMGRTFYRVYMKTTNMTSNIEQEFVAYLTAHPKVTWIVELDGDLDFLYVVWAKDISEFEDVYNQINDRFSPYLSRRFFSVMTKVYYFKYKYLVGKENNTFRLTGGKIVQPDLDSFDLELLRLLSNSGRLSLIEIAKALDSNTALVHRRMKKLEEQQIITCYNLKVNHKLLGFTQRKVMLNLNDTSQASMKRLISFLMNHKSTIYITIAIGQYDLEFEMMERSHEDFHHILKELKNTFEGLIKEYFTVIFYHEHKVGQIDFNP